jgi:predicted MFS family arabinose efflux permease
VPGTWIFDKEIDHYLISQRLNYSEMTQNDTSHSIEIEGFKEKSVKQSLAQMNVRDKESPIKFLKSNPILFLNLIIIMLSWISTSFNNYLLGFSIRNFGGNIYYNIWAFGLAGIAGKVAASVLRKSMSSKISLFVFLAIVAVVGTGLIFFTNKYLIALSIGIVNLGIGGSFTIVYFVTTEYFPPLFTAFAFAVCQVGARATTISSYVLSDLKHPIPTILLVATTIVSIASLFFLSKPILEEKQGKKFSKVLQTGEEYKKLPEED